MARSGTSGDTMIYLEDNVGQQQPSVFERYGIYSNSILGMSTDEQLGKQPGEESTHHGRKVLSKDRDPKGINKCLKVSFADVIAEPASVRSSDRVWLWSHALFEVARFWFYRLVSLLLAGPLALVAGLLFAILSCLHIWLLMPSVQLLLINLHWVRVVWSSVLDLLISPFFSSLAQCCGAVRIRWVKD